MLALTFLFWLARLVPLFRLEARSVAVVFPLAFALWLWLPSFLVSAVIVAVLLSGWLPLPEEQNALTGPVARLEHSRLLIGLLASERLVSRFAAPPLSSLPIARFTLASSLPMPTFDALAIAFVAGMIILVDDALLLLATNAGRWRRCLRQEQKPFAVRASCVSLVVFLTPMGAARGLMTLLPLALLLFFLARVARQAERIQDLRRQLRASEAMSRSSLVSPDADEDATRLWLRFLTLSKALVSADQSLVWTPDSEGETLLPAAALPLFGALADLRPVIGKGLIGRTAANRQPRRVADAANEPLRDAREPEEGAWLIYPVVVHHRLLGVAHWIRSGSRPFTQDDVTRLDSLVPQVAIALENARIREEMRNLASTDGLTGLWNHRRLQEVLREEVRRATRYHRPLSIIMLDVDSFKSFNDTYGHPQGDALLRTFAQVLASNIRAQDYVGRYGGEEFMIILPETPEDAAHALAERIRMMIEENAAVRIDGALIRRTASLGVASLAREELSAGELVQRADDALYRAKRNGKNRVVLG